MLFIFFQEGDEEQVVWELWETRSVRFPRSGGRGLGVHGSGSFHGQRESFVTMGSELGHLVESATSDLRLERQP